MSWSSARKRADLGLSALSDDVSGKLEPRVLVAAYIAAGALLVTTTFVAQTCS